MQAVSEIVCWCCNCQATAPAQPGLWMWVCLGCGLWAAQQPCRVTALWVPTAYRSGRAYFSFLQWVAPLTRSVRCVGSQGRSGCHVPTTHKHDVRSSTRLQQTDVITT
jgi:hypothetical protein